MPFTASGVLIDRGDGVLIPIQPVSGPGIPGVGVVMEPPPGSTAPPSPPPTAPPAPAVTTEPPAPPLTAPQQTAATVLTPTVVVSSDGDALVPPSIRVPQGYLGFYSQNVILTAASPVTTEPTSTPTDTPQGTGGTTPASTTPPAGAAMNPVQPVPVQPGTIPQPGHPLIDVGDGLVIEALQATPIPPTLKVVLPGTIPQPGHPLIDVGDGLVIEAPQAIPMAPRLPPGIPEPPPPPPSQPTPPQDSGSASLTVGPITAITGSTSDQPGAAQLSPLQYSQSGLTGSSDPQELKPIPLGPFGELLVSERAFATVKLKLGGGELEVDFDRKSGDLSIANGAFSLTDPGLLNVLLKGWQADRSDAAGLILNGKKDFKAPVTGSPSFNVYVAGKAVPVKLTNVTFSAGVSIDRSGPQLKLSVGTELDVGGTEVDYSIETTYTYRPPRLISNLPPLTQALVTTILFAAAYQGTVIIEGYVLRPGTQTSG